ncbi:MAG: PTS sugar transporter subunit IIC [Erysipelotrichaceae bacterium]|nr:PTS sugar transporter subunit IIC [Erysipelotrichaceae bacterium]
MGNWLEEKLLPAANKLAQNKFLSAVRDGVTIIIPFSIIGAFALIVGQFPVESWMAFTDQYADYIYCFSTVTLDCLGILALIGVSYNMAVQYGVDPISNVAVAVATFFMLTLSEGGVNLEVFSAAGMFCAIVVSYAVTMIYRFLVQKNITIRMPDGVPPAVSNSFTCLIPGLVCLLLAWLIRIVLNIDVNGVITALFSPLVKGMNSLPGYVLYVFLMCLLWVVGIHGDMTLAPIAEPITLALMAENMEAFKNGAAIPNIATFSPMFVVFTGTGCTIGLVINMLLSKSKRYNELGKLSVLPGLFNINEPQTFGAPVVMNPVLAIPYIGVSVILTICTWLLMQFNIIGRVCVEVPWTTPPIIGAYLATGFNIPAAIWNAIEIVISFLVYRPFFKKQEAIELEMEKAKEE